ncbi:hypothetical protein ABEF95_007112 [Exophiala dermatitidis]
MGRRQRNNYAYASGPVLYQPAALDQAGVGLDGAQYRSKDILVNSNGVQPVGNNASYSPVYYHGCPCGRRRCRRSCGMVVAAGPAAPLPPAAGPLAVMAERRGGRRCACGRGRGRGRGKGYGPISLLVDGVVGLAKLCADKSSQKDKKNEKDVVEPVRDRENVEEREEKGECQHDHDDYDDEYEDDHEREHLRQYQYHPSETHTHVCDEDGYADAELPSYQAAVGKSQKNPSF